RPRGNVAQASPRVPSPRLRGEGQGEGQTPSPGRSRRPIGSVAVLLIVAATQPALSDELRVCADPNNLPFSDTQQQGFENKLADRGITGNIKGYMVYGDYRQSSPPSRLIEAVEKGEIDLAAAWGPLAGYAAKSSPVPLRLTAIDDDSQFAPLKFRFALAMGVRKGDHALREQLDQAIARKRSEIRELL